jgi:hypothetical protein
MVFGGFVRFFWFLPVFGGFWWFWYQIRRKSMKRGLKIKGLYMLMTDTEDKRQARLIAGRANSKVYYILNKARLSERVYCDCGGYYRSDSKTCHVRSKRHINYINGVVKIEPDPFVIKYFDCACGRSVGWANKSHHIKSESCIAYFKSLET